MFKRAEVAEETTESTESEYAQKLKEIVNKLHESDDFDQALPLIEPHILELLNCERVTVYQRGRGRREIISKYKSGEDVKEIRVPLSTASIAGYSALSQKTLIIEDAYNDAELKELHKNLRFGKSFDQKSGFRTRSIIAVPIKFHDALLGVLQLLNRKDGEAFTEEDKQKAEELASIIGQKFRYEMGGTKGPYEYLVQKNKIRQNQLDELKERAEKNNESVNELLMSEAGISRAELGASLERYYQVPFRAYDPNLNVPMYLLKGVNQSYIQQQLWCPIEGDEEEVTILIDDPSDASRIMEIQQTLSAKSYVFNVGLADDIRRFLGQTVEEGDALDDIYDLVGKLQEEVEDDVPDVLDEVDENEGTVIQLVNKLIIDAYKNGASDIHIEPGKGKANASVRIRVDGVCRHALAIPPTHIKAVVSRIKIMSGLDISERRKPQDGKAAIKFRGQTVELRVATLPTVNGESAVLRILASSDPLPLDKLNFSERNEQEVQNLIARPHGIFLVVGPTGSGKTTTLHAILGHINTPERKIWTAEDPVEITQTGIQQVQVKPKIGFDFASALRAFLRADPDVIMIGEMRDRETSHSGVEASLTGHLVFSTLHTNSAPETVTRLLDLGLDPVSFSDALIGVLAQRLVRTLCKDCKQSYKIPEDEFNTLRRYYGEEHFDELNVKCGETEIYKAVGCNNCGNTGYKGRTGIHELLVVSEDIKELIYKAANVSELQGVAIDQGMRTLMQDGIWKLFKGQTDIEQIRRVATA